ncbi:MAG: 16S rRNA (cytidine(1402)-2'-O)-methyltransferase [Clostridia bacterium]
MFYLVATPIGNLEDITYRAVRVLKEVTCIYAEDTRNSLKLLNSLGIKKPIYSCHLHNEEEKSAEIADKLREGLDIAYISDAGCPGISDPGARLVRRCIENDLSFTVLPGANAALTALVLSGLPSDTFTFQGFLPRTLTERSAILTALLPEKHTLIFYESPNRISDTIFDLLSVMGDREAALLREITKIYEEARRGKLSEIIESIKISPVRGECVIVVAGCKDGEEESPELLIKTLLLRGISVKEIAKQVSAACSISKNKAYEITMKIKEQIQ